VTELIAFLGTGNYEPTEYWTDDFSLKTRYVQIASAARIKGLERLTVLATKEALEKHQAGFKEEWERLPKRELWADVELGFRRVPDGHTVEEAVGIFKEIAEGLGDNTEVYFDMTHGFRSQPLIGLLALQYLEAQRQNLVVKDVTYGVYVPGNSTHPDNGRLVSLADFLIIKDWAYGTRLFRETGSVKALTGLAKDTHNDAARAGLRPKLQPVAAALEKWSTYVESAAVEGVATYSKTVVEKIQALREDEVGMAIGHFFVPLLDELNELIAPMQAESATNKSGLGAQLNLLRWVVSTGRYQLAVVIAREWMVSLVVVEGQGDSLRKDAEFKLGASQRENSPRAKVWSGIADIRNKFSHAWMGHELSKNPLNEARKILDATIEHFQTELEATGEKET